MMDKNQSSPGDKYYYSRQYRESWCPPADSDKWATVETELVNMCPFALTGTDCKEKHCNRAHICSTWYKHHYPGKNIANRPPPCKQNAIHKVGDRFMLHIPTTCVSIRKGVECFDEDCERGHTFENTRRSVSHFRIIVSSVATDYCRRFFTSNVSKQGMLLPRMPTRKPGVPNWPRMDTHILQTLIRRRGWRRNWPCIAPTASDMVTPWVRVPLVPEASAVRLGMSWRSAGADELVGFALST